MLEGVPVQVDDQEFVLQRNATAVDMTSRIAGVAAFQLAVGTN
jgi:hypothetical protein